MLLQLLLDKDKGEGITFSFFVLIFGGDKHDFLFK